VDIFEDQPTDRFPRIERDKGKEEKPSKDLESEQIREDEDEVEIWLEEGEEYLEGRNSERAIELFEKVLRIDPNNLTAYEKLSIAKSIQADQNSIDEYMSVGRECIENEDWGGAAEEFQAILAIEPDHDEARELLLSIKPHLSPSEQESIETIEDGHAGDPIPDVDQPGKMDQEFEVISSETHDSPETENLLGRAVDALDEGEAVPVITPGSAEDNGFDKEIESAISLYEAEDYQQAKRVLTELNRNYPDRSQITYYLEIINRKLEDGKSSQNQEEIEQLFKKGMDEIEKDNHAGASHCFREILSMNPEFHQAKLMLEKIESLSSSKNGTESVKQSKRPAPARPVIKETVQPYVKPGSSRVKFLWIGISILVLVGLGYFFGVKYPEIQVVNHLKSAKSYYAEKEFTASLMEIEAVKRLDSANLEALELEGSLYMAMERGTEAAASFKKALDMNPQNITLCLKLGEAYFLGENYTASQKQFTKAADNPAYRVEAFYRIALCQIKLNQMAEARNSLRKALELNPEFAKAHLELAKLLQESEEPDTAEKEFLLAIEKDPKLIDAYTSLGKYYVNNGRLEQAKETLNQPLLWLKPSNREQSNIVADMRYRLGQVYFDLGDYENAQYQFNKIIEIKQDPEIYMEMGKVYYKLKKENQAILAWKKVLELDPDNANAHFNLGTTYYRLGKMKTATDEFNEAIRKDPKHAKAYANLGFSYYKQYKYTQAVDAWNKSLELLPDQPVLRMKIREIKERDK
jgi:tetratricopeptide (TPR) repeat protein